MSEKFQLVLDVAQKAQVPLGCLCCPHLVGAPAPQDSRPPGSAWCWCPGSWSPWPGPSQLLGGGRAWVPVSEFPGSTDWTPHPSSSLVWLGRGSV